MEEGLKYSIVKIITDSKIGVGFFISPSHIFTASHIIEQSNTLCVYSFNELSNSFDNKIEVEIFRMLSKQDGDITLLKIERELNYSIKSLNLILPSYSLHNEFICYGFPLTNIVRGSLTRGTIGDLNISDFDIKEIELNNCPKLSSGYSGSPVYDSKLQGVIGMITSIANTNEFNSKVGFGFAVTSDFISEKFPSFYVDSLNIKQRLDKIRETISVGDKLTGEIIDKVEYGYFISFKGVSGLLHNNRIINKNFEFKIGDKIEVIVYSKRNIENRIIIEFSLPKNKIFDTTTNSKLNIESRLILECSKKRITSLTLKDIGLKNLSSEIKFCSHIKNLDLSDNNISTLPPEFAYLQKLENLNLANNRFGKVPEILFSLPNLKRIDISYNYIETIKSKIFQLDLINLNLKGNPITVKNKLLDTENFQVIREYHNSRKIDLTNEIAINKYEVGTSYIGKFKLAYKFGVIFTLTDENGLRDVFMHKSNITNKKLLQTLYKVRPKGIEFPVKIHKIHNDRIEVTPDSNFEEIIF